MLASSARVEPPSPPTDGTVGALASTSPASWLGGALHGTLHMAPEAWMNGRV
jgi:hypothetical protein